LAKNKTKTILILVIIFEVRSSLRLPVTFCRLPQWGISEHFTVNQAQMLIEALHLI
jgi:hypothetical protein